MEDRKLTVRAVERALDILMCFTKDSELALTEISTLIGLHKSTVHRLLTTLEDKGFVVRNKETEKYRLGLKIWSCPCICLKATTRRYAFCPQWRPYGIGLGNGELVFKRRFGSSSDSSGSEQPGHSAGRPGRSATSVVGWRFQQGTGGLCATGRSGGAECAGLAGICRPDRLPGRLAEILERDTRSASKSASLEPRGIGTHL